MNPRNIQRLLSLLVAALVASLLWLRQRSEVPHHEAPHSKSTHIAGWEILHDCRLVSNPNNDGDSFLVSHEGRTHTFRLYFVDCPEKTLRTDNQARLQEQARYFQLPSAEAASLVGKAATTFVLPLLARPFTVITHWERVFDSQRHYAQVLVETDDHHQRDLAELLVEQGLARIFTKGTELPGMTSEASFKQHLHTLESASRAAKRGAWK